MKSLFKLFQNRQTGAQQLHPWDIQEMNSLVRKLNVSPKELNDAIIDTGSLDINYIKAYLRRKKAAFSFQKFFSNPVPRQFAN